MNAGPGWDAGSYERVSKVQQAWGERLIGLKKWEGNEVVIDAGCGPGTLTKFLAEKVPLGKVYAVDSDPGMVSRAKSNLSSCENVHVICSDMSSIRLPTAVNVVFSNAAIHWVMDEIALFENFKTNMAENGDLLLQYGGKDNLGVALGIADEIRSTEHFARHFFGWKAPWRFSSSQETHDILVGLGFRDVVAKLSNEAPTFTSLQHFTEYLRTVILRPYLQVLEADDRELFLRDFVDLFAKRRARLTLDYVRLTVTAKK